MVRGYVLEHVWLVLAKLSYFFRKKCLKTLRKKCINKARIEASIAEASIREEVANFTTSYYKPNLPSKHNPPPRYNAGEVESTLSLFKCQLGSASGSTPKRLDPEE